MFTKMRPAGDELCLEGGQTERQTDRHNEGKHRFSHPYKHAKNWRK
jgi:hypothetical protein